MGILNRKVSFRLFAVVLILVLAVLFTAGVRAGFSGGDPRNRPCRRA